MGSLPFLSHPAAASLGDVQITSSSAPASVPSGTFFTATFTATNNGGTTVGPVMLTDRVIDRPPFLPGGTFLAEHANGAYIDRVTTIGVAATCGLTSTVTDWATSGVPPAESSLLGTLDQYSGPLVGLAQNAVSDALPPPNPAPLPGQVGGAVAQETGNPAPSPVPPVPSGSPPTPSSALTPDTLLPTVLQTARCVTNGPMNQGDTLTMSVRIFASRTSAAQTAPTLNHPLPPELPETVSSTGLCGGAASVQPARVCASAPAEIVNAGDVRVTNTGDIGTPTPGVAGSVSVLKTDVTPEIHATLHPDSSATDGASAGAMEFIVTLDRPSDGSISVSLATTDGTALSNPAGPRQDYLAPSSASSCTNRDDGITTTGNTLTIPAGQNFGLIEICLHDNGVAGLGNLTFSLTISNPTTTSAVDPTVVIDNNTATGTINPDE